MRSVMQHRFSQVPSADIPRSSFDRSHGVKTTFDSGYLVPFFLDEVLPGDTFNLRTAGFARMSTPLYPVMDNMFLETFYFFVPIRLVWNNFQKMMGEQTDPGDSIDYIVPTATSTAVTGYGEMSLQDYMGLPTKVPGLVHNNLPLRCYNLVYNEFFRDQNLQDSVVVDKDDGPDSPADYVLLRRGKRHDYFTSCLPWPQKGTAVDIPLGTSAPVLGIGKENQTYTAGAQTVYEADLTSSSYANYAQFDTAGAGKFFVEGTAAANGYPNVRADLSNATAATINQLRQAFQIQKMYERDARSGSRYTEIIKAHFGVLNPDRGWRPEYLGGGSQMINVHPIAATANTANGAVEYPVGSLGGMVSTGFNGHGFTKSFTEHGYVIGIVNVRADLTYQQGLNKLWSRSDRLDFYWPALSQIGEQAVLTKEIYCDASATDDVVLGYQERFGEYRYKPSQITGQFRSNSTTPLDAWHLSQDFPAAPTLNAAFIVDEPPIDRVVAVPGEPQFIGDFYHRLNCVRPMPLFGVPGNIDRF